VDVKAEGEEAVILLAAIHRFLTGEDPPEEQVAFNRRTVEGYARYYKIARSLLTSCTSKQW
jgi:endo-1,4-beta-D-glucanase Y